MVKKKNIKLTEHVSYCIIDSTIYLFQNSDNISSDEMEILCRRLSLIIEDNDISYINISARKIEDRKEFYQKLGFSLSYYDVNKLNILYEGKKFFGLETIVKDGWFSIDCFITLRYKPAQEVFDRLSGHFVKYKSITGIMEETELFTKEEFIKVLTEELQSILATIE